MASASMHPTMIRIPTKDTQVYDWKSPLMAYIESYYDGQGLASAGKNAASDRCERLDQLRQDMHKSICELCRYLHQLELLDLRFPLEDNVIRVPFIWSDAFSDTYSEQTSRAHERVSVIFNLGARLSCQAISQASYKLFLNAASFFIYIKEQFRNTTTLDLEAGTLRTLVYLMLAQAQELYGDEQAVDKSVNHRRLAGLASKAGHFYRRTVQAGTQTTVLHHDCLVTVKVKALLMDAKAQYYQALDDAESHEKGSAVARFRLSECFANTAYQELSKARPLKENQRGLILDRQWHQFLTKKVCQWRDGASEKIKQTFNNQASTRTEEICQGIPMTRELKPLTEQPGLKLRSASRILADNTIQQVLEPDLFQDILPVK